MRIEHILMLALAGFLCLAPFTVYLLWLCSITRRTRPTIVSGRWDFAILAVGLLGFVLYGGGLLLSIVHTNALFVLRGNWQVWETTLLQERGAWAWTAGIYFFVVIGLAALEITLRWRSLVIYNITSAVLEPTLEEIFTDLGQPLERQGNTWSTSHPMFRVTEFEAGHTATLRWLGPRDGVSFAEVERHLRQRLPSHTSPENPANTWLTTAAIASLVLGVVSFAILMLLTR